MALTRRQFLLRSTAALCGTGLATAGYTTLIEPYWLDFPEISMPIRNLPDHLRGTTLMQISDIHIGRWVDDDFLIKSLRDAGFLNPDFVVYTGDFVSFM